MKKILAILFTSALLFACGQTAEEKKEEAKMDSAVENTIKSDKEKADSVLEHYQNKMKEAEDSIPQMPE